jgi:hypothetical protein
MMRAQNQNIHKIIERDKASTAAGAAEWQRDA